MNGHEISLIAPPYLFIGAETVPVKPVANADLSDDEMVLLLRATLLRAKTSGAYAETAGKIKTLLLS